MDHARIGLLSDGRSVKPLTSSTYDQYMKQSNHCQHSAYLPGILECSMACMLCHTGSIESDSALWHLGCPLCRSMQVLSDLLALFINISLFIPFFAQRRKHFIPLKTAHFDLA